MAVDFNIAGEAVRPGEHKIIQVPMPKLYDCTPIHMPVHVIRGKKEGPTLVITAAIHGDEVNGVEIVRRLIKKPILKKIAGTIIAIPIVNVYGFLYQDRYLMDRRDLNRSFPGSAKGSLGGRLAHLISKEIISKATHCIDLHSGSLQRTNLPQIRADLEVKEVKALAKAFNAPIIMDAKLRDGSLRQYANDKKIPFLLYEAGESSRLTEVSIKAGLYGILNIMNELGMIRLKQAYHNKVEPTIAKQSHWLRASHSGMFVSHKRLGDSIKVGDKLAIVANPMGNEEYIVSSPLEGIIIGMSKMPMVHEGAALFNVATFKSPNIVEAQIENLYEIYV